MPLLRPDVDYHASPPSRFVSHMIRLLGGYRATPMTVVSMLVAGHVAGAKSGKRGIKDPSKWERREGGSQPCPDRGDSPLGPGHPIADTRLREYESWAPGIVTKLSAQQNDEGA